MKVRDGLLMSVAGLSTLAAAEGAELPAGKAAAAEYMRACPAFGTEFVTIPGTDTCLRIGGFVRYEFGYQPSYSRNPGVGGASPGDLTGTQGRLRINLDARTQTDFGTLRAFARLDLGSRTGFPSLHAGALNRNGTAFPALGQELNGRVQMQVNADKAFVQFAGLTAGRASSFFDFYAHDFELGVTTLGSDNPSTNLAAYTAKVGEGFSATLSVEDPTFRRTPVYSPLNSTLRTDSESDIETFQPPGPVAPVFVGLTADGRPSQIGFVNTIIRTRMPDAVGVLRYDQAWGSAQLSAATNELNVGGIEALADQTLGTPVLPGAGRLTHTESRFGFAVQAGLKLNLSAIAAGDGFYLQLAYGEGSALYTGLPAYNAPFLQAGSAVQGAAFTQFLADAVINPLTNRLELTRSGSATAAYLHYWVPTLRSGFFASYGALAFAPGARAAQGSYFGLTGLGPGLPGTRFYALNQALRDNYRFGIGANLIWSPVKDLDIGGELMYTIYGPLSGRILDQSKRPGQNAAYVNNLDNPVVTATSVDVFQARLRVQRNF